jgi:hypothetical protein
MLNAVETEMDWRIVSPVADGASAAQVVLVDPFSLPDARRRGNRRGWG